MDTNKDRNIIILKLENMSGENNGSSFGVERRYAPDFPIAHETVVP